MRRGDKAELMMQDVDPSEYICSRIEVCSTVEKVENSDAEKDGNLVFQKFGNDYI